MFDGTVVLNLRKKHLIPISGKKKSKRILVVGENFKLRKLPSKDLIALFSSRRRACLVLKHNRVSEVIKGFKVHDFEYLLRSKKLHFEIEFMSLEICHLLLTSKKLLENELRFVTDVVLEYFAMLEV